MFPMEVYIGTSAILKGSSRVIDSWIALNTGTMMPVLGLGTWLITGKEKTEKIMEAGLKAGYRAFDTAAMYNNEEDIGAALKKLLPKFNLKREDIFITTKLLPQDHGEVNARVAVERSVANLGVDYVDLYLIHWPGAEGIAPQSPDNAKLRAASWKTLCQLHNNGKGVLRAIGVSNYAACHLIELLNTSDVKPAVNQVCVRSSMVKVLHQYVYLPHKPTVLEALMPLDEVEFHPYWHHPPELLEVCQKAGILLQSYSSLGGTSMTKNLLHDPVVSSLAEKLQVSPARFILRWVLQRGFAAIPRSQNPEHVEENTHLDFVIPDEEMKQMSSDIKKREKYDWDPDTIK